MTQYFVFESVPGYSPIHDDRERIKEPVAAGKSQRNERKVWTMKLNKEKFLKSELGGNLQECVTAWDHWLTEKDNQKCIADFEKISLIYLAVKENVWDYGEMDFYHNSISIAFKLCRNEELTSSDWKEIKESIDEELLGVHDGNNATKMLFDLLLILSKYDYSYAEAKLITIYNRTDLYSSKALEILGELHSEFAYKEFLKKIIIAEQETECFHTAVRLIGFFPEREKAIIEYIKILDDSRLVEVIHEKAQKALANKNKIVDESIEGIPFVGKKCSVLSNNIVLNELLIKLGEQIKATQFFAAVGFSFSSGLRLVKPLVRKKLC